MLEALQSANRLESLCRTMAEEANRRRVAIISIDARGLDTREDVRIQGLQIDRQQIFREEISQPQEFLAGLSAATGGRSFTNSNDLQIGMKQAYWDAADYYELSYVPDGKANPGKLHKIEVKARRPHLQVLHRQGYAEPGG
jgi:VWFA-related protein